MTNGTHEVLIIGGGPAGLSAALSLGRMSRTALVCDDSRPRNAPAEHMNNFPSHDGLSPRAWREKTRQDLSKYKAIEFFSGSVTSLKETDQGFSARLSDDSVRIFRKIILAHGIEDKLSDIKGLTQLWGKAVYHCPYCHGFEVKGLRLGLVIKGPMTEHMLPMIYSLSSDLILFTQGTHELSDEFLQRIRARRIRIIEDKIAELEYSEFELKAVKLESGERVERDGLFWAPNLPYRLKSDLGVQLGCELTDLGLYKINDFGKTTVEGIFAAGDISKPMHSVLMAASAGQLAGAAAAGELLAENFVNPKINGR